MNRYRQFFFAYKISLFSVFLGVFFIGCQPLLLTGNEPNFEIIAGVELFLVLSYSALILLKKEQNYTHPFLLFLYTTSLFIGGRFVGKLLGVPQPIFVDYLFSPIELSASEKVNLISLISGSLAMIFAGFMTLQERLARNKVDLTAGTDRYLTLLTPILILVLISTLFSIIGLIQSYQACLKWGYMGLYKDQSQHMFKYLSIGQYGLLLSLGLSFATTNRTLQWSLLAILGAYFFGLLYLGLRGGFISYALFFSWFINKNVKRLNLVSFILIVIMLFSLAQLFITIGFRAESQAPATQKESNSFNRYLSHLKLDQIGWFAFLQGTTLVYTGAANRIIQYPLEGYFQSIIPGFNLIALKIHPDTPISNFFFSHHLAKTLSEQHYLEGYGIGWSLYADLNAFSFQSHALVLLLGFLLGYGFSSICEKAKTKPFYNGMLACILMKILMLPRAGIYSIIPYMIAYTILYQIIFLMQNSIKKRRIQRLKITNYGTREV